MIRLSTALAMALALVACSPDSETVSKAPEGATPGEGMGGATLADFKTDTTLKDLMAHVIDFSAFGVWHNQGWLIDDTGTHELFPQDEAGWVAAESAAFTLAEAANSLLLPGRPMDDDRRWVDWSHQLYTAAKDAQAKALAKDKQSFFEAGSDMYDACVSCHNHYVQGDAPGVDAKLPQLPNRTPPPPGTPVTPQQAAPPQNQ
ncbi:MAG: hypothetical protein ABL956_10590 [Hyphomonadaceae bacterium]